jgi:hypothetical protein
MFKGESLMGALVTLRSLRREPDEPSKQSPEDKGRLDRGRKLADKENAEPSRLSNSEKIVF